MPKKKDTRNLKFERTVAAGLESLPGFAAASVSFTLPSGHALQAARLNRFTGSPALLTSTTAAPVADIQAGRARGEDVSALLIEQALEHVLQAAPALGFAPGERAEFVPDPHVEELAGGAGYAVHLYQQFHGIPVFQMTRTVRFDADGAVTDVAGNSVSLSPELSVTPRTDARVAAVAAARFLAAPDPAARKRDQFGRTLKPPKLKVASFAPRIMASFPLPPQPAVLDPGDAFAEPIPAHLVLFYAGETTRLGWHFVFTLPGYQAQYVVIVAADGLAESGRAARTAEEPAVLYSQETSSTFAAKRPGPGGRRKPAAPAPKRKRAARGRAAGTRKAARPKAAKRKAAPRRAAAARQRAPARASTAPAQGRVFTHNPGMADRVLVDFPRAAADYPFDPTPAVFPDPEFPRPWCDEQQSFTLGNCTIAVKGMGMDSLEGVRQGGALVFDPADRFGDEQKILNIFYFCNYMHDFFYMLGFDEPGGNFQAMNFTGQGLAGDAVLARAHPGPVNGTANMMTLADGRQPLMNMGLVGGVRRHTALDSDVVFHEFTHGVSNRLVGGRLDARGLQEPQSVGMGEGWSDYFALTVQNYFADQEKTVTGDWVVNSGAGIRRAPYDENYPFGFGDIQGLDDEHDVGEIWCAALMQMNRNLGRALGSTRAGHMVGWQIVVDGLKLTPSNPSFLDARDAVLRALEARTDAGALPAGADARALRRAVWEAFARFGMGVKAHSVGATLEGVVEDKTLPADL